jgi:hypothetical protein
MCLLSVLFQQRKEVTMTRERKEPSIREEVM